MFEVRHHIWREWDIVHNSFENKRRVEILLKDIIHIIFRDRRELHYVRRSANCVLRHLWLGTPCPFDIRVEGNCDWDITDTVFTTISDRVKHTDCGGHVSSFPVPCSNKSCPSTNVWVDPIGLDPTPAQYTNLTKFDFGTPTNPVYTWLLSFSRISEGSGLIKKS